MFVCICTYVYARVYMYARKYTYAHVCAHMHAYVYIDAKICTFVYIHCTWVRAGASACRPSHFSLPLRRHLGSFTICALIFFTLPLQGMGVQEKNYFNFQRKKAKTKIVAHLRILLGSTSFLEPKTAQSFGSKLIVLGRRSSWPAGRFPNFALTSFKTS